MIKVEVAKTFFSGPLRGYKFFEPEDFGTWEEAVQWAKDCNKTSGMDFEVSQLRDSESGKTRHAAAFWIF